MSILIRGVEMPNTCKACVCSSYYDRMDMILCDITNKQLDEKQWKSERHPDCPFIEVLTPHGRLGDLDELKKKVLTWLPSDPCGQEEKEFPFETDICVSMLMEIEEAESIIEAED